MYVPRGPPSVMATTVVLPPSPPLIVAMPVTVPLFSGLISALKAPAPGRAVPCEALTSPNDVVGVGVAGACWPCLPPHATTQQTNAAVTKDGVTDRMAKSSQKFGVTRGGSECQNATNLHMGRRPDGVRDRSPVNLRLLADAKRLDASSVQPFLRLPVLSF